jgi:hypothetical protein
MEDFILLLHQSDSFQQKEVKLCAPSYSEAYNYAVSEYSKERISSIHREGDKPMGQVFFYEICAGDTLKPMGSTDKMPFYDAIDIYANTHNPASQILSFWSEEDYVRVKQELEYNVQDRKWLDELFECI